MSNKEDKIDHIYNFRDLSSSNEKQLALKKIQKSFKSYVDWLMVELNPLFVA